jgi:S-adenosylmethionine:tRNA ribosyltransferase-isomerase
MRLNLFDFPLPEDRIALRPAHPRDSARMLIVRPSGKPGLADATVRDLPGLLRPGDALVVNDTRVIPARLLGIRVRGETVARIEATLHRRDGPDRWRAFLRPAKRVAIGERIRFGENAETSAGPPASLDAEVVAKGEGGEAVLAFALAGPALDEAVSRVGHIPLPPYIAARRQDDALDRRDYQTHFAREEGAVAAPTAGLHFTDDLVAALAARGISLHTLTLHVGAGTFLPVKVDDTREHKMHPEWGRIDEATADALNATRAGGGRIISVGTTSLRLLESAADEAGVIHPFAGDTAIFITPGYRFRAVDALMTNFHLPRSTLFMLVSAFCGLNVMQQAYRHAIDAGYRFYSYGDASLLFRAEPDQSS